MVEDLISGKSLKQWITEFPILNEVTLLNEVMWVNPNYSSKEAALSKIPLNSNDVNDAAERLKRFAPFIAKSIS